MTRYPSHRLTALRVRNERRPGLHSDGAGGLFLQVTTGKDGQPRKSWLVRVRVDGRVREMGLGSADTLELAAARRRAEEARRLAAEGIDPIEQRRQARRVRPVPPAPIPTFKACAQRFIETHGPSWKNAKHRDQWTSTLETYVYPHFGDVPVAEVDVNMVLHVLEPIWSTKPETARRVRSRIERVLDWARSRGFRKEDNPARLRGHLENILPARRTLRTVRHHPALPYAEVASFMAKLKTRQGMSARALEFVILTASRTSEVLQATWSEIDLEKAVWVVPATRMKAKREHRVPLSSAAIDLLKSVKLDRQVGDWIYPGAKDGASLSSMAMLVLLRKMGRGDLTTHGMRSTFRDWAAETTDFPGAVAEAALAHVVGDKVEAAYRRGDLFEKRRALMAAWAAYCYPSETAADGNRVIAFRR